MSLDLTSTGYFRIGTGGEMGRDCQVCKDLSPRPRSSVFEEEIHDTIVENCLFKPGERVATAASVGKDSTVCAHVLTELNRRHNYGLDLFLLSVDEGITGHRDDSLETVERNEVQYGIPLEVVSYKQLYEWTMDEIVKEIGRKNNCTFCGKTFRRQALERGASLMRADKMATGHNADDIAETVLLNVLRGDIARLQRCTSITTGDEGALPRCKPFQVHLREDCYTYAYFKKLDYFSTECIYSPNAFRGYIATGVYKRIGACLGDLWPRAIVDIIRSAERFRISSGIRMPEQGICEKCAYISSQRWCKACVLLDGLNKPRLGISPLRTSKNPNIDISKGKLSEDVLKKLAETQVQSSFLDF